ncbi:nucleotidyltransferase domain-containing protein [Paenibacillus sp. TAB 01]|uniref:nucleotidyltransferase domain-containing protein n=1 Tax=Paenibacillus sp. TAB 01 TaxID=3368988 RepID=UPI0037516D4C
MIKFDILNKKYKLFNDGSVDSICLFGSYARGDYDDQSDIDLLIIVEDCDEENLIARKKKIEKELELPYHWLSVYRKSSIKAMHKYGSYFLWHIKNEGKILYSRTPFLSSLLDTLPPYLKTRENLIEYLEVCGDIKKSIQMDAVTLKYDLSILASIIRNTCIALCFLYNKYDFGKYSVVKQCQDILGREFPITLEEYEKLYNFRLIETRNLNLGHAVENIINKDYLQSWIKHAEDLIHLALDKEREVSCV